MCDHNGKPGVSTLDLLEHGGNKEFGSASRDVYDLFRENLNNGGFDNPRESSSNTKSYEPVDSRRAYRPI